MSTPPPHLPAPTRHKRLTQNLFKTWAAPGVGIEHPAKEVLDLGREMATVLYLVDPQDGNRETKVVQVWGHSNVEGEEDKYEAVLVAEGSITTMEDLTTFLEANNMEFGAKGDVSMFTSSGTKISPPFERMSWDNVPYYCSSSSMLRTRRSQQGSSDISLWTQAK